MQTDLMRSLRPLAALAVLGLTMPAQAIPVFSTVFQDGFDTENGGIAARDPAVLRQWRIEQGGVDLVELSPVYGLALRLGPRDGPARVRTRTPLHLDPGRYVLSFAVAGSGGAESDVLRVSLGGILDETFSVAGDAAIAVVLRRFELASAERLSLAFAGLGSADGGGAIIDSVVLESDARVVPAVVPAPGSLALLLGPAVALAARRRRRRAS